MDGSSLNFVINILNTEAPVSASSRCYWPAVQLYKHVTSNRLYSMYHGHRQCDTGRRGEETYNTRDALSLQISCVPSGVSLLRFPHSLEHPRVHSLSCCYKPKILTQCASKTEIERLATRVRDDPSSLFYKDRPGCVILSPNSSDLRQRRLVNQEHVPRSSLGIRFLWAYEDTHHHLL